MNQKENTNKKLQRFKVLVLVLNLTMAAIAMANVYTVTSGAIQVELPDEKEPSWSMTIDNRGATFLADFNVSNMGLFDIKDIDISAELFTESGNELFTCFSHNLTVRRNTVETIQIKANMPMENVNLTDWLWLFYHDSNFTLSVDIEADYLWGLATFSMDQDLEYAWTAPIDRLFEEMNASSMERGILKMAMDLLVVELSESPSLAAPMVSVTKAMEDNNVSWGFHIEPVASGLQVSGEIYWDNTFPVGMKFVIIVGEEVGENGISVQDFSIKF